MQFKQMAPRTGLLAVLFALAGFSYALATSSQGDMPDAAGARAVGSYMRPGSSIPLDFANPFVSGNSGDRDLGDAVIGSSLTRLVRAKGGVSPYRFATVAGSDLKGLKLLLNGILTGIPTGTAGSGTGTTGSSRFNVTVTDRMGSGSAVTNTFRLTFVTTTEFRFALGKLADGVQFQSFSDTLKTINGAQPITYTATSFTLEGQTLPNGLADVGLSMASDGAIFGVPLRSGSLRFVATAKDKNGVTASNRNGNGISQTITMEILPSNVLASLLSTQTLTIKAGFGPGKDSIAYKGIVNLNGSSLPSLASQALTFRVASYTSPTATFDTKGKALTAKGAIPGVNASVKNTGLLAFKTLKDTINVGAVVGPTVNLTIEFRIGDSIIACEPLQFVVKGGKFGARTLTYKGTGDTDRDGSFMLTSVAGADDKGQTGDAWKVMFLGRTNPDFKPLNLSNVNVSIGTGFAASLPLLFSNTKASAKGNKFGADLAAFSLDTKSGKGSFSTGMLPSTATGISTALKAGNTSANFAVNMTFPDSYAFEGALAIFPLKTKWGSKTLTK